MKQYLVTIDGGTTNTRMYLWNQKKECIDVVKAEAGARLKSISSSDQTLTQRIREMFLELLEQNHLEEKDIAAIYASGMITSKEGLLEVPHLTAPADQRAFQSQMVVKEFPEISSLPIYFVRGMKNLSDGQACQVMIDEVDVCRGEETEVLGILELLGLKRDCLIVLPGSHMKFVAVSAKGELKGCVTSISGELLSALTNHTILAGSLHQEYASEGYREDLLKMGYDTAKATSLTRAAFSVRMLDMFRKSDAQECAAFLLGAVLQSDLDTVKSSKALCVDAETEILIAGKEPFASALDCLFRHDGYFHDVNKIGQLENLPYSGYGAMTLAIANGDFLTEKRMTEQEVLDQIKEKKLVAIIRGIKSRYIKETAEALLRGGISMMEITFDHTSEEGRKNTLECLELLRKEYEDRILLGAGTVLTEEDVRDACEHGARYIISPNVSETVIRESKRLGMISMPGAHTPTEIANAYAYGADIVKIFPADAIGIPYIKAIKAPLAHIPMMAVGGINEENIPLFQKIGIGSFGIGSNLVNAQRVETGNYDVITETAKRLCALVS